ncbi:MAG: SPASM domain-containing protein [Candidatus Omnitrophica bacterium]|nr:SPASM domain-containing protein [Candidatus Omnitrophota bacterium]
MKYIRPSNHKDILRLKGILDDEVYIGPKYLTFDITDVCNMNCIYCYRHSPLVNPVRNNPALSQKGRDALPLARISNGVKSSKFKHLPFAIIKRTIEEARELGVEMIVITGDGEPILHPRIREIIDYLNRHHIPYGLDTNATCLEQKNLIPYLLTANFIEINLAAANPKMYKLIHCPRGRKNFFYDAIKNIKALILAKGTKSKPNIHLNFVITNKNISHMKRMFGLAKSLGLEKVIFNPMVRIVEELKSLELSDRDIDKVKRIAMSLEKEPNVIDNNLDILNFAKSADLGYGIKRCYLPWFFAFITANGQVGFCYDRNDLVVGNLNNDTLKHIWEGEEYHQLRLKFKYQIDLKKQSWQICKFCEMLEFNKDIEKILKARNLKHNGHKAN